mgnify:CR=1 FL=1
MKRKSCNSDYSHKISKHNLTKLTDLLQDKLERILTLIKLLMNKMHGKVDNKKYKNLKDELNNFSKDLLIMVSMSLI